MNHASWLLLLAALLPIQDAARDVDALVAALDAETPEARQQAETDLLKIGKPAIAALGKASKEKGELGLRAKAVLRRIRIRLKIWDADPVEAAKKVFKDSVTRYEVVYALKGVAGLAERGIDDLLPACRWVTADYEAAAGPKLTCLAVVDIDGQVVVAEPPGRDELNVNADKHRNLFLLDPVRAATDAERRLVARLWVWMVTAQDLIGGKWWGNLATEDLKEKGTKVTVSWVHGKSHSWTDVFTVLFDAQGVVTDLQVRAIHH